MINRTLTGTNGKNIDLCSQLCSGKGIPHTVNGLDLLFQPQFAAQMLDMYIHRAAGAHILVAPGRGQQFAAGQRQVALADQHLQQGIFPRGQPHRLAVFPHAAGGQIYPQVIEGKHLIAPGRCLLSRFTIISFVMAVSCRCYLLYIITTDVSDLLQFRPFFYFPQPFVDYLGLFPRVSYTFQHSFPQPC